MNDPRPLFNAVFASLTIALLASTQAATKPNIVFVLFDDIGYGQPPSYREASGFNTPNIDRLAREGMRFTDAHSAAANCTPTRYGILTGRYPSRIGQFGVVQTFSPPIIPKDRLTVASFLQSQGYDTACIGKWHLGMNWTTSKPGKGKGVEEPLPIGAKMNDGPNALGFDYFYGFTHARNIQTIIEQDQVVEIVEEVENQPLMTKKAVAWLRSKADSDKPFFLYFPTCPPHNPIVPAPEFEGKGGMQDSKESKYADWVYQGDHMLGEILDTLEEIGKADNTLVIATGDNGAAGRAYPPLRASKSSIYEGGHREPFVARWPGKITPDSVCDQTICLNDFFATCADLLDQPLPDNAAEDSFSILPLLLEESQDTVRPNTIHQAPAGLALRQGPWKLISLRNGTRELYNLESDQSETQDVYESQPEVAQRLTTLLDQTIQNGRSNPGPPQPNDFDFSKFLTGPDEPKQKKKKRSD
ncbi:MAG: arylsulfatase [Verrucomicrobiota bacterium]